MDESNDESTVGDSEGEEKTMRTEALCTDWASTPREKLQGAMKMAEKFIEEKEVHKAIRELTRYVALTRIIYGDGHWKMAQAFTNLAHGYMILQGLTAQAIQHAELARHALLTRGHLPSSSLGEKGEILGTLVTLFYTLGAAHLAQNNGKESYVNLQKAEKIMEELQELDGGVITGLKISQKDLVITLGRTCLQQNKLGFATGYFEKAVTAVTSAEGDMAPELISLYQEIAQMEQLKENHEKAIGYLLKAHSICVALHRELSIEAAQTELLLGKAYAATGEEQHIVAAERHFTGSLSAYQTMLSADDTQTLRAVTEFSKWLVHIGKKQQAYKLLDDSLKANIDINGDFSEKTVEIYHLMGSICLAEGEIREAHQLFNKCLQIQLAVYGPQHRKPRAMQELLNMLKSFAVCEGKRPLG
ncbi:PREDICTED: tetratricopeptide repeat protein 23-like [Gavialis gangeticus]|uniref:tetratricopeptide repeat protein 23-like n=1 Tax=Gavialis gangeticus TaxID=94835 RepID=UPI00092F08CC|nr:PREDICTED: tetratricopeptide repeat protein 23-like [Gavialis gangeticus]